MNERDFLTKVSKSKVAEDIKAYAISAIAKLDDRNKKRLEKMTPKQIANNTIKGNILEVVQEPMLAAEIAKKVGYSTQKTSALCIQLVKDNLLKEGYAKVKGRGLLKTYEPILPACRHIESASEENPAEKPAEEPAEN